MVGGLRIQDVMIFEIIRVNQWKQPIYLAVTVSPSNQLGLTEYLRMDGQAYKIIPQKIGQGIDPDVMYENIINTYRYTNLDDPDVYYPENVQRLLQNYRKGFLQLVYEYGFNQQDEKALDVLRKMDEFLPDETIPITIMDLYLQIVQMYNQFGDAERAREYMEYALANGREVSGDYDYLKVASIWNDLFDETGRAIEILLPLAEKSPNNPQITFELARAYVKEKDLINGDVWVERLASLVPNAREVQTLRDALAQARGDTLPQ